MGARGVRAAAVVGAAVRRPKAEALARFLRDAGLVDADGNPVVVGSAAEVAIDANETGTRVPVSDSGEFAVVPDRPHMVRALGEGACLDCGRAFVDCGC